MKKSALLLALALSALPLAAKAELVSIQLQVSGVSPATGSIEASLFNSADTFMVEVLFQESGEVSEDGTFSASFFGLEEGDYAIVVVHDANDNGVYDTGFMGIGGESVAYSNGATSLLGRPGFEDASFSLDSPDQLVEISMD